MSEDKELMGAWQSEFESEFKTQSAYGFKKLDGEYCSITVESGWQGFLLAKRSQPAITVPAYDMHHYAPVRNLMAKMDSAGIKYTIGE